ncbi:hypothetical protein KXD40_008029 [Peronospora effusa]|uniref:Uncharacterized protein n=1 Tax=Peronospora effusa TaxID=542832 RepID=A0A3M6VD10_9STRA|nr:hypothetical protein DD238_006753 [Peronospora effusa]RQM12452.1 hypothetical protein DD237_000975 [Peronospora effusa]UIZ24029.1 hypothetical protein KXD40_008029 [Peronospora effusa]CAI5715076.1 unnamed protein product [Peronospora effusa]
MNRQNDIGDNQLLTVYDADERTHAPWQGNTDEARTNRECGDGRTSDCWLGGRQEEWMKEFGLQEKEFGLQKEEFGLQEEEIGLQEEFELQEEEFGLQEEEIGLQEEFELQEELWVQQKEWMEKWTEE